MTFGFLSDIKRAVGLERKMGDLLGWQNTRWGMTGDEIVRAVGADVVKRSERQRYHGAYSVLCIPNVSIGSHSFKVMFQMDEASERLSQVLVSYEDLELSDPRGVFEVARCVLTERFDKPERVGTAEIWQWTFETTYIELSMTYLPGVLSGVCIRFFPADGQNSHFVAAF